jgi:hypothetical protein
VTPRAPEPFLGGGGDGDDGECEEEEVYKKRPTITAKARRKMDREGGDGGCIPAVRMLNDERVEERV